MAYISGSITEDTKIIVLDSNHNKITSKDFTPDDGYTKLLLHFDEATLVDSSVAPKTLTLNGVARSATQSKFGGYSGLFNGSNQYITISDSTDWDLGTGDFTIDMWVNFNAWQADEYNQLISHDYAWYSGATLSWMFYYANAEQKLIFGRYTGADVIRKMTNTVSLSLNTWYHLAVVRNGNALKFFINGAQQGTDVDCSGISYDRIANAPLYISLYRAGTQGVAWLYFNGYKDELRISKGIARWTANFTPPAQAYKDPVSGGSYTISNLSTTSGTVIAMANSGEVVGYNKINFIDLYSAVRLGRFDANTTEQRQGWTMSGPWEWISGSESNMECWFMTDNAAGNCTSDLFNLRSNTKYLRFYIRANGNNDQYVQLLDSANNVLVVSNSATGTNDCVLRDLDVSAHVGKDVRIRLLDNKVGSYGQMGIRNIKLVDAAGTTLLPFV